MQPFWGPLTQHSELKERVSSAGKTLNASWILSGGLSLVGRSIQQILLVLSAV
jgi:hypothetical protein